MLSLITSVPPRGWPMLATRDKKRLDEVTSRNYEAGDGLQLTGNHIRHHH